MVLGLLLLLPQAAVPDAREIVRRSIGNDAANWERARNYTYVERVENREVSDGKIKSVDLKGYEITILFGRPYRRLIERGGRPLPPAEEAKEQQKLSHEFEKRRREKGEFQEERKRRRELTEEIPEAYDLRLAGRETVDGRPAWAIEFEPRSGYRGKTRLARILPKFRGRVLVDQETYEWARVEAESVDTVSFGVFLARLGKGARLKLEYTRVNGEIWLPKRLDVSYSARLALLRKRSAEITVDYSGYRKFTSEGRLAGASP